MQLQLKFVRLDLDYSDADHHFYRAERLYLSPYAGEEAEHFARRLLSLLVLFPRQVAMNLHPNPGKTPDLYIQQQDQHLTLWCQVDMPAHKQLQKACHQSDEVWLIVPEQDAHELQREQKMLQGSQAKQKVHLLTLNDEDIATVCTMLRASMKISVWCEAEQLTLTDGVQSITLPLQGQGRYLH